MSRVVGGKAGVRVCVPGGCVDLTPPGGWVYVSLPPRVFGWVWVWEPVFPPASVRTRQGATRRPPSRGGRVTGGSPVCPPPPLPEDQAALRPAPSPKTPTPAPPAPGPDRRSPRPAHLAATRTTPGNSGLAGPRSVRNESGPRTLRDGRGGGGAARVQLGVFPPSAEEQYGDGQGWGLGDGAGPGTGRGGAWGKPGGPWALGSPRRRPPRPLPDCLSLLNQRLSSGQLFLASSRCVPAREGTT